MNDWCAQRTTEQALGELERSRIPAAPVRSPRQVLDDPVVRESNAFEWMAYPGAGSDVPIVATPVGLSLTPPNILRRPPTAGEHTDEVLREVGYSSAEIDEFRGAGVI
jgi:formyl-CoA transferase